MAAIRPGDRYSEQWGAMNDLLVIAVRGAQRVFLGMRGADTAHDQTIYAKPINNLVQCTLEKEGGVTLTNTPSTFVAGKVGNASKLGFRVRRRTGERRRDWSSTSCVGRGITDGEDLFAGDILIGAMTGGANKTKKIIPPQRYDHVFGESKSYSSASLVPMRTSGATVREPVPVSVG